MVYLSCTEFNTLLSFHLFPRDFDANLYLCEEAFGLLPFNTFGRLSDTLLFYAYIFVLSITVMAALAVAFHNLRYGMLQKPVLCFNELVLVLQKNCS